MALELDRRQGASREDIRAQLVKLQQAMKKMAELQANPVRQEYLLGKELNLREIAWMESRDQLTAALKKGQPQQTLQFFDQFVQHERAFLQTLDQLIAVTSDESLKSRLRDNFEPEVLRTLNSSEVTSERRNALVEAATLYGQVQEAHRNYL